MQDKINEFKHFLKEKRVWTEWKRELAIQMAKDNENHTIDHWLKVEASPSNWISGAFLFHSTKKGTDFWWDIEFAWQDIAGEEVCSGS